MFPLLCLLIIRRHPSSKRPKSGNENLSFPLSHCIQNKMPSALCSEEPSVLPHCVGISYYTKKLLRQILQAQQLFNDIQFA